MELHGVHPSGRVLHRGDRDLIGACHHPEPFGLARDGVPVAHPHGVARREVLQQLRAAVDRQRGAAVLTLTRGGDLAAERPRHQLMAVADAQHRHPQREQPRVDLRRARLVHRRRTTAEDDPGRTPGPELVRAQVVRNDLGVDVRFPHTPRDQLRVLRAQIDDEDRARAVGTRGQWPIPTRCWVW